MVKYYSYCSNVSRGKRQKNDGDTFPSFLNRKGTKKSSVRTGRVWFRKSTKSIPCYVRNVQALGPLEGKTQVPSPDGQHTVPIHRAPYRLFRLAGRPFQYCPLSPHLDLKQPTCPWGWLLHCSAFSVSSRVMIWVASRLLSSRPEAYDFVYCKILRLEDTAMSIQVDDFQVLFRKP